MSNEEINKRANNLVDMAEKQAGVQAIQTIVKKHLEQINKIRKEFPLDNIDLVTSNIVNKKGIIGAVSKELGLLHKKIRVVIENVATAIENGEYEPAEKAINDMSLGYNVTKKASALIAADKKRLISCRSLSITMEIFSEFNKSLEIEIEEATKNKDIRKEGNLIIGNAILVYELTDYVINYINEFKIEGTQQLLELYNESKKKNEKVLEELEALKQRANTDGINEMLRKSSLVSIEESKKAIDITNSEWDKIIEENGVLTSGVNLIKSNIPTLQFIKDRAKAQLNVMEAISVLQIVRNSIGALEGTFKTLEDMKLASLPPDRIKRLLGITDDDDSGDSDNSSNRDNSV